MLLIYYKKFLFPYFQILFVPWHVISLFENQQSIHSGPSDVGLFSNKYFVPKINFFFVFKSSIISKQFYNTVIVDQLLFACDSFLRCSREPRLRKELSQQWCIYRMVVVKTH